jgi:hypothetical protein
MPKGVSGTPHDAMGVTSSGVAALSTGWLSRFTALRVLRGASTTLELEDADELDTRRTGSSIDEEPGLSLPPLGGAGTFRWLDSRMRYCREDVGCRALDPESRGISTRELPLRDEWLLHSLKTALCQYRWVHY